MSVTGFSFLIFIQDIVLSSTLFSSIFWLATVFLLLGGLIMLVFGLGFKLQNTNPKIPIAPVVLLISIIIGYLLFSGALVSI